MEELYLIAVYGDLRKGGLLHNEILGDQTYIGEFDSEPIYDMYSLVTLPALVKCGSHSIKMEVYEVTGSILNRIHIKNSLEKGQIVDNFYNLEEIETPFGTAKLYLYNRKTSGKVLVESGDWITFKRKQREELKQSKYGLE